MKFMPFPFFVVVFCLTFGSLSIAALVQSGNANQEEIDIEGKDERWYKIELLIYEQRDRNNKVDEIWPTDIQLNYPTNWVRLKSADEYIADPQPHPVLKAWLDHIQSSTMTPFVILDEPKENLLRAGKKNSAFPGKILWHKTWWQPFIPNDEQAPIGILIRTGNAYGEHYALEGSVSFKLTRYLHIMTNLWFTEFIPNTAPLSTSTNWPWGNTEAVDEQSPWPPLPALPELTSQAETSHLLQEESMDALTLSESQDFKPKPVSPFKVNQIVTFKDSRRMRSNEIHYIDHPKLGILVRLTPYEVDKYSKKDKDATTPAAP